MESDKNKKVLRYPPVMLIEQFRYKIPDHIIDYDLRQFAKDDKTFLECVIKHAHADASYPRTRNIRLIGDDFEICRDFKWIKTKNFLQRLVVNYFKKLSLRLILIWQKDRTFECHPDLHKTHDEKLVRILTDKSEGSYDYQIRSIFKPTAEPGKFRIPTTAKEYEKMLTASRLDFEKRGKIIARHEKTIEKLLKEKRRRPRSQPEEESSEENEEETAGAEEDEFRTAHGEEVIDISDQTYVKIIKTKENAVAGIIKHIHLNDEYPSFQNIVFRDEGLFVHNGKKWINHYSDYSILIETINRYIQRLSEAYGRLTKKLYNKTTPDTHAIILSQLNPNKSLVERIIDLVWS